LYDNERRSPLFPDLHQEYPEQPISRMELRSRLFPFQDCQLLPQRGILQCDLFVAGKGKHDESQCAENRPEHDATLCLQRWRKSISSRALPVLAKDNEITSLALVEGLNSGKPIQAADDWKEKHPGLDDVCAMTSPSE